MTLSEKRQPQPVNVTEGNHFPSPHPSLGCFCTVLGESSQKCPGFCSPPLLLTPSSKCSRLWGGCSSAERHGFSRIRGSGSWIMIQWRRAQFVSPPRQQLDTDVLSVAFFILLCESCALTTPQVAFSWLFSEPTVHVWVALFRKTELWASEMLSRRISAADTLHVYADAISLSPPMTVFICLTSPNQHPRWSPLTSPPPHPLTRGGSTSGSTAGATQTGSRWSQQLEWRGHSSESHKQVTTRSGVGPQQTGFLCSASWFEYFTGVLRHLQIEQRRCHLFYSFLVAEWWISFFLGRLLCLVFQLRFPARECGPLTRLLWTRRAGSASLQTPRPPARFQPCTPPRSR